MFLTDRMSFLLPSHQYLTAKNARVKSWMECGCESGTGVSYMQLTKISRHYWKTKVGSVS